MANSQTKLIIFDSYGVCLSSGYPDTCRYLAKKYGRDWKELYEVLYRKYFNLAAVRKITQKQAWELAVKELKLPLSAYEVQQIHYNLMKINLPVLKTAQQLKKQYKILLLSKNTRTQFADMQRNFPIFRRVFGENMINTWEYRLPKASKKTMLFIFKRYCVKGREVIYTDDQESNLEAPRRLGMRTIFFKSNRQWLRELKKIIFL